MSTDIEVLNKDEEALDAEINKNTLSVYDIISEHPSQYTVEQRVATVLAYIVNGHLRKTAEVAGVPFETLKWWKYRTEWWEPAVQACRREKQDELDGALTDVLHKALGQVGDRVLNGDTKYDSKTGSTVKIPMSGKELATVAGILFDKRAAMRGDPTSITRQQTPADHMKELESKFQEFTERMEGAGNLAKPISEQ